MEQGKKKFDWLFFVSFILLTVLLLLYSFTYEQFTGESGGGYSVGFTLSTENLILWALLILSVPVYLIFRRKII